MTEMQIQSTNFITLMPTALYILALDVRLESHDFTLVEYLNTCLTNTDKRLNLL